MSVDGSEFSVVSLIAGSSGGVQAIMVILFIASIISWKLIFEYSNKIKKVEKEFNLFTHNINNVAITKVYNEIKVSEYYGINKAFLKSFKFLYSYSNIMNLKKSNSRMSKDELKKYELELVNVFEDGFNIEVENIEQGLKNKIAILGTISSTSPYIGLLGTVYGILIAFWGLGMEKQATIATVAPSIAEALIATAMGLFVAIPALIYYNRLNHRVDVLLEKHEQFSKNTGLMLKKNIIHSFNEES